MSTMTFYTNPHSRGRIVRWMLEEIGEPYQVNALPYGPKMKTPEFLALNPMGKVPTLVHGNQVVTECAAICAYLADAFPQRELAPPPDQRADYYRWLFFAAGPLEAAIVNQSIGWKVPEDKKGMVGYGNFELVMETLRLVLSKSDFMAGKRFSAVDVYLGAQIGWGLQFKSIPDHPEFKDYYKRVSDRPAYHRATELDDALAKDMAQKP